MIRRRFRSSIKSQIEYSDRRIAESEKRIQIYGRLCKALEEYLSLDSKQELEREKEYGASIRKRRPKKERHASRKRARVA